MNKLHNIWGSGQLLAFSGIDGQTDFDNGLCLRTARQGYAFELKNIDLTVPDAVIRYTGAEPETLELTGDLFKFYSNGKVSSGVLADACNLLLEGEFAFEMTPGYEMISAGERHLVASKGFLKKEYLTADIEALISQRAAFLRQAVLPEGLSDAARQTAVKALSQIKTQIYAPEGQIKHYWSTPDRWPHKRMWLWDSVFHSLGMRHFDLKLAKEMISAMFDLQQPDGLIPHSGSPSGFHPCTQPPILSLAMRILNDMEPDPAWIAELAPKLERHVRWMMANRDTDGAGLLEWEIEAHENCRSGESGMDNSPRFDGAIQLDAPDFNAYVAFECESLAMFLPEKRAYWQGEYERLCRLMRQRLWSDKCGMFVDFDVVGNERTDIMSNAGFLPLYCGAATKEQAERMVRHLTDPETFGTPLRIPTIARNNVNAYKKDMWRGPVWINVNYLISLGLQRYGYDDLARSIMQDTMREEEKWLLKHGTFFEFYDDRCETDPKDLERKGKMPAVYNPFNQSFHDYGWSATLYLEMIHHPEWN